MKKLLVLLLALSLYSLNAQVYDTLVWADEFNGTGGVDTSKWWHQTVLPNAGQAGGMEKFNITLTATRIATNRTGHYI